MKLTFERVPDEIADNFEHYLKTATDLELSYESENKIRVWLDEDELIHYGADERIEMDLVQLLYDIERAGYTNSRFAAFVLELITFFRFGEPSAVKNLRYHFLGNNDVIL